MKNKIFILLDYCWLNLCLLRKNIFCDKFSQFHSVSFNIQNSELRFGALYFFLFVIIVTAQSSMAQTLDDRIDSLISQMTLSEKILQLHQEGGFNTADNTRLGIPGLIMSDGPHGVRNGMATSFPVGIGMAATWDKDLIRQVGVAMGQEFRGKGIHQMLGPAMDICRDPRYGRSPESGGEDSYLCAQITTSLIRGAQSTGCIATAKHYNTNGKENNRLNNNVSISQRNLMEEFGLNFRTAVQEGGVLSVMNAYNLINGQKCAENPNLLTNILRDNWGYPFYVVSDWGSIWNTANAVNAGCNIDMGDTQYHDNLLTAVNNGSVSISTIDNAVKNVLRTKILSGLLDYYLPGNGNDVNSLAHQQLCLQSGRESLVLLKNQDNILPVNKSSVKTIAVIGPSANICQTDASGSSFVSPFYTVSPVTGITNKIGASKVIYYKGCDINSNDTSGFAAALFASANSDYVVYVGGLDGTQEGEGFDRATGSINLPGQQQNLINRLSLVNKNLICVIESGGICGLHACIQNIKGLIYGFYPGQEGGNAIADVIFGDYNPGGKLPVTMPQSDSQLPPFDLNYDSKFGAGYRWFDQMGYTPEFVFGYGLSYATFKYSNLIIPGTISLGQNINVSVDVTNTGLLTGDEVAQLYLSHQNQNVWMPVKQLRAFQRITLQPGETKTIKFTLTNDDLYYFDETSSSYRVDPGTYTVRLGGSSGNLPDSAKVVISPAALKPDLVITNIKYFPRFPLKGDKVVFLAMVKNQGTAASPSNTTHLVTFSINGKEVSRSIEFKGLIPVGGMALVSANTSSDSMINSWSANQIGNYEVEAKVNTDNSIDEIYTDNNSCIDTITVFAKPAVDIAIGKTATASSLESTSYPASNAVDGNNSTRWSSQFSDPQWLMIDLGSVFNIDKVVISWEAAYAKEFELLISNDGLSWSVAQHITNGTGGLSNLSIGANARFIKMLGLQRGTQYGYSIYEFEIFPVDTNGVNSVPIELKTPEKFSLDYNYPNPFNPSTTIRYHLSKGGNVKIDVYNISGQSVKTLVDSYHNAGDYYVMWDGRNDSGNIISSGTYFYRITAGNFVETKKMIFLK
ncbi:MAG: glycoside hydrolase family 3 C-terminal domain-containing protein [Ignavibacteriaceae bacterium]